MKHDRMEKIIYNKNEFLNKLQNKHDAKSKRRTVVNAKFSEYIYF